MTMAGRSVNPVRSSTICIGTLVDFASGPVGKEIPSREFCAASALPDVKARSKAASIGSLTGISLDFSLSRAVLCRNRERIGGPQQGASLRVCADEKHLVACADQVHLVGAGEIDAAQHAKRLGVGRVPSYAKLVRPHPPRAPRPQ